MPKAKKYWPQYHYWYVSEECMKGSGNYFNAPNEGRLTVCSNVLMEVKISACVVQKQSRAQEIKDRNIILSPSITCNKKKTISHHQWNNPPVSRALDRCSWLIPWWQNSSVAELLTRAWTAGTHTSLTLKPVYSFHVRKQKYIFDIIKSKYTQWFYYLSFWFYMTGVIWRERDKSYVDVRNRGANSNKAGL